MREIKHMLTDGEQVLLHATQSHAAPGGAASTPNSIFLTNYRIIFKNPKWWGLKADIETVEYRDVADIRLKRGVFSSEIYLKSRFMSDNITVPALPKKKAEEIVKMIEERIRHEREAQAQDK